MPFQVANAVLQAGSGKDDGEKAAVSFSLLC